MSDMVLEHYYTIIKLVLSRRALIDSRPLDGSSRDFFPRFFANSDKSRGKKNITLLSDFKIPFYEILIREATSSILSTKNCCFTYATVRPTNNCDICQGSCSFFISIFLDVFSLSMQNHSINSV